MHGHLLQDTPLRPRSTTHVQLEQPVFICWSLRPPPRLPDPAPHQHKDRLLVKKMMVMMAVVGACW